MSLFIIEKTLKQYISLFSTVRQWIFIPSQTNKYTHHHQYFNSIQRNVEVALFLFEKRGSIWLFKELKEINERMRLIEKLEFQNVTQLKYKN